MESKMTIVVWKQVVSKDTRPTYRLQLEGKMSAKERRKILAELKDWKEIGYGWHKNGKAELRLFTRAFQDKDSWIDWAKEFPFELQELNRNGKAKKIN
tara:strand:- start:137 stop:430 length:294 start_codon:yes stop_codon:yes gene_type:complete